MNVKLVVGRTIVNVHFIVGHDVVVYWDSEDVTGCHVSRVIKIKRLTGSGVLTLKRH